MIFGLLSLLLSYLPVIFTTLVVLTLALGAQATKLSPEFPWQFRLAAYMRTPILVFIVVPLSALKRAVTHATSIYRNVFRGSVAESKATHAERANQLLKQVKQAAKDGKRMRTARPNWAQMSVKLSSNKTGAALIECSHLDHILDLDLEALTVTVEPFVTMGQLTETLLHQGFAIPVQIEMESITVGGAAMGFGIETTSHAEGFFQETVLEYELATCDGELKTVTPSSDKDLFYALPWSMGCLGFLASIKLRLIRIHPYVQVTYIPTHSAVELQKVMEAYATEGDENSSYSKGGKGGVGCRPDFVEATVYTKDTAVVQIGRYHAGPTNADEQAKVNGVNYWWKPFYYKWVQTFLPKLKKGMKPITVPQGEEAWELIPTKHYMHRFTRSIFWELEDMIPFSNHPFYRAAWGWLGPPEVSLLKLCQGPVIRKASLEAHVVQESYLPIQNLSKMVNNFDNWFEVYPVLVFPVRVYDRGEYTGMIGPHNKSAPLFPYQAPTVSAAAAATDKDAKFANYVCVGAYGTPRTVKAGGTWNAKANCREMDEWTRGEGGWVATYTDLFCTRKEFRSMFDHALFDKVRSRWSNASESFPEPFDKVRSEAGLVDLTDEEEKEKKADKKNKLDVETVMQTKTKISVKNEK